MTTILKRAQVLSVYLAPEAPAIQSVDVVPSSAVVGSTFMAYVGATGNPNPDLSYQWKLDGGNVGTDSDTYVSDTVGSLTCEVTATNGEGSPAVLESAPATVSAKIKPDPFTAPDWSVQDNAATTGDEILIIINSPLPYDGGSAITDIEYRIGGGAWTSLGVVTPGNYVVGGLAEGVQVAVSLRLRNAIDAGDDSDFKQVVPSSSDPAPVLYAALPDQSLNTSDPVVNISLTDHFVLAGDADLSEVTWHLSGDSVFEDDVFDPGPPPVFEDGDLPAGISIAGVPPILSIDPSALGEFPQQAIYVKASNINGSDTGSFDLTVTGSFNDIEFTVDGYRVNSLANGQNYTVTWLPDGYRIDEV